MTLGSYIKDNILVILLNIVGAFLLILYLLAVGNSLVTAGLIFTTWMIVFAVFMGIKYHSRHQYFQRIEELMVMLDQPYLVQECMDNTGRLEDHLYQEILRKSNKGVIEHIRQLTQEQKDYREFIEAWIHEVKLPLTGIRLASHNGQKDSSRRVEMYLEQVENAVDQALFYARSEQVYKDFFIVETDLKQIVTKAVSRNKHILIQNQMSVHIECEEKMVFADGKWVEFILGQILINAVKYSKPNGGEIKISAVDTENGIRLTIRDRGIGIPQSELGRIFEKGFTGTNGRSREKSTGIGLYLCSRLCRKMGLELGVDSVLNEFTQIYLFFPKSSYLTKL